MYRNFTALYYEAPGTKIAKQYSQLKNSTEYDISGLDKFKKQAKPYKSKK